MFKAPEGTKAKLKRINPNLSALLREQVEELIARKARNSAFDKVEKLCGSISAHRKASTSKDYLKQYAKKSAA